MASAAKRENDAYAMNSREKDIFHDMQHVCKSGSVFCQKGKASSCNNCQYYEGKAKELALKNDECQKEIHRLCQTVSSLKQKISDKISENNTIRDKIEQIRSKILEQNESAAKNTVKDVSSFLEIPMVVPKEEPLETLPNDLVFGPWQRIGYIAEESSQTTADTVQIKKEPEEKEGDSLYEQCRVAVERDEDGPCGSNALIKKDPTESQDPQNTDAGIQIPETRQVPVHDPNRPHTCLWMMKPDNSRKPIRCEKAFPSSEGLQSHFTSEHLAVAKRDGFVCLWEGCARDKVPYRDSRNLQYHFRNHSGDKPYPCPQEGCGRTFNSKGEMGKHRRMHTGEKPFTCPNEGCGKPFVDRAHLNKHMRIHTGEKPYTCPIEGCGKTFADCGNVQKHMLVHTGEKPHPCPFGCGANFSQAGHVKMHFKRRHTKITQ